MLDDFNGAPEAELRGRLKACCAASAWVEAVIAGRPYPDETALEAASDIATALLGPSGLDEALAGHPRIGERSSSAWSRREQAGLDSADAGLKAEIAAANAAYERRFGRVYLVCAAGRGPRELLALCRARLGNSPETEIRVALGELAAINRLRLTRLLHPEEAR